MCLILSTGNVCRERPPRTVGNRKMPLLRNSRVLRADWKVKDVQAGTDGHAVLSSLPSCTVFGDFFGRTACVRGGPRRAEPSHVGDGPRLAAGDAAGVSSRAGRLARVPPGRRVVVAAVGVLMCELHWLPPKFFAFAGVVVYTGRCASIDTVRQRASFPNRARSPWRCSA